MGFDTVAMLLESKRFYLRPLAISDANLNYLNWLRGDISEWIDASNIVDLSELVKYISSKINSSDTLFLGIFEKNTNIHIGNIKYEPINKKKSYAYMGVMIGDKRFRGVGVFVEVFKVSADYLKKNYNIEEIRLGVHQNNISAIKAYIKAGFSILNIEDESILMKLDV